VPKIKDAKIVATGSYVPSKVLTNFDLEKMVDTSNEWIITRTGIKERRIAQDTESVADMGYKAALTAIKNADIDVSEIELIIVSSLTPDYIFPSTACLIQEKIGASNAAAFDLQAACTGYVYGLSVAKSFVSSGMYKKVLFIAAEKNSSFIDYTDRSTCVLFGDGASACIISSEGKGFLIDSIYLGSEGKYSDLIQLPAGGSRIPASNETVTNRQHYLKMLGNEVFKHAVLKMESSCKFCLEKAHVKEEDISWIVPHQANLRIIEAIQKRFKHLPAEKVYKTLDKYGNTSSSSVGIALDELIITQNPCQGELILLTAFGAGLTWGAVLLKVVE
jgi:3-oxoacyl-[acyl-carrier-protein] synthase-3